MTKSNRYFCALLGFALWGAALSAEALQVRVATWNVLGGIDTSHDYTNAAVDIDYKAVTSIVARVRPDILCFNELYAGEDYATWVATAAAMGYPYTVFPAGEAGTFDGSLYPGVWSKYPVTNSYQIKETDFADPTATYFTRWPLHTQIQVPGALQPFHVFVVHNRSGTETTSSRLNRGLEIYRTANFISSNLIAQYPLDSEYAIMGDWNDTIETESGFTAQNTSFTRSQYLSYTGALDNTTTPFDAGSDMPWETDGTWVLPYSLYPVDRLTNVFLSAVDAAHTGSTNTWTQDHKDGTGYRLDYILFSDEIVNNSYGPPVAEVYFSPGDGVGVGLTKYGDPLPAATSSNASDHRMVFADFNLIDEVGGITPIGLISEIVDHQSNSNANYVEICNIGTSNLDLSAYQVRIYTNKNSSTASKTITLSGELGAGQVYTLAASTSAYAQTYSNYVGYSAPDYQDSFLARIDGNDPVALYRSNSLSDIYGKVKSNPLGWGYTNANAVREHDVQDPSTTWQSNEWTIAVGTNAITPGTHQSQPDAAVSLGGLGLNPFAPVATNLFSIQTSIFRNRAATNLSALAKFRINGGVWIEAAMTNSSGYTWQTPEIAVAKSGGDVMEYFVQVSFYDYYGVSTNSPKVSTTNVYTFPAGTGTVARLIPMFNEVQADGEGADTNEFIELIAPAGTNLVGYTMRHYNAATNVNGPLWTYTFPSFTVPDDGILDRGSNHLGFVVLSQISNNVANTDVLLPGAPLAALGNGPHALVLYDPATNIVDAVVWLATLSDAIDTDVNDPGGVSRIVPAGSVNYLHNIGIDPSTDNTPQAPNNLLTAVPGTWETALATPGALNFAQTSGYLVVSRLDLDQDGVLDDEDNCDSYNPTQTDTDNDGIGDECDADDDGDGVLDVNDNCQYNSNADQSDIDFDGIGDECDEDIDGDGIANESDPDPYTPPTQIFNFEYPTNLSHGTYIDLVPELISRSYWVLSNALIGTTTSDLTNGLKSLRFRAPGEFILQGGLPNGISTMSFAYGRYGTDAGVTIAAQYKKGTNDWTTIASVSTEGVTSLATNTATPWVLGPVEFRFICSGTTDLHANLDDISITEYRLPDVATNAQCTLVATNTVAYDGYAHPNAFLTDPPGLDFTVEYTNVAAGTVAAPIAVGTYSAIVTIPDTNKVTGGTFVFTNSVNISQGTATCTLDSAISAAYDGAEHTNTFTVTPGMAWTVTYASNGLPEATVPAPVEPGGYDATVEVTGDANATGGTFMFSNAVIITKGLATCAIDSRITANYDGLVHTNTFTVSPTGLPWSASYSPTTPQNVGIYSATVRVTGDVHYAGSTSVFPGAVTILDTSTVSRTAGSPYVIDFETYTAPSSYAPVNRTLAATNPVVWYLNNAITSSTTNDVTNGLKSIRLRYIDDTATSNGVMQSTTPFSNGIHSVAFNYALYGTSTKVTLSVETSANGVDWTSHTNLLVTNKYSFLAYSNTFSLAQASYMRFLLVTNSNNGSMMNIDDIVVLPYEPLAATVTLSNLTQTNDYTPKSATATTVPAGLNVAITYDGSATPPSTTGSYAVVATVSSPGYAGSASGTLTIVPGLMAPQFNAIAGQTAYVDSLLSFKVGATGYPDPVLALTNSTATAGAYSVATNGAELTVSYTPPAGDLGSRIFSFSASNSLGVATTNVTVTVSDTPPGAPASIWASATNFTDFTAAWSEVSGATSYRLDVGTNSSFTTGGGGGGGGSVYTADFEDATKASYAAGDVTLNGISWNMSEAVIGTGTSDRFIGLKSARVRSNETVNAGILRMNADTNMGLSSITLLHAKYGTDGATTGRVDYSTDNGTNWTSAGTFSVTSTNLTLFTATNLNVAGNVRVRVVKTSGTTARYNIDNITLYPYALPTGDAYYVPGYSNLTVNGTNQIVSGLASNTTYYFRVRAVSGTGTSSNSATANVTTRDPMPAFTSGTGMYYVAVGVATSFTVSASGEAPVLALQSTTATNGYSFPPATNTGMLSYTPPEEEAGERTFTFTASNAVGVATQTVHVWVGGSAPEFATNAVALSATAGVAMATYTVNVSTGAPTPVLVLKSTTASNGYYWFTNSTGTLDYTPPQADCGTRTFTFTASNDLGVATQLVTVTVYAAPVFNALGAQGATTDVAMAFTVGASGYPVPLALALTNATASGGYSFNPASGVLSYTPPYADVGTQTFSFTASNSMGVVSTNVQVTVTEGLPPPPAALWASATNTADFTAAWTAVANASDGYRLDVSTNATFIGGAAAPVSTLAAGDIAIIGANFDSDKFTFVALANLDAGTVIYFTENGWTNDHLRTGEGTVLWSNSSPNPIMAGTMVTIIPSATASTGTVSGSSFALSASGDQILAYQRTASTTTMIYAVNSQETGWQASATNTESSGLPTGLTDGTTAIALNEVDNFVYGMSVTTGTKAELLAAIGNKTNWTGSDSVTQTLPPAGAFFVTGVSGTPSYVPGYSSLAVSGTSHSVTGLAPSTTYYFRMRSASALGTGAYSSVASATTVALAPYFTSGTSYSTTNGVQLTFTETVTGDPAPVLALESTTASSGYSFIPATGVLTYTPPPADAGTRTFTFTASNTYGVATQVVDVAVYAPPVFDAMGTQYATSGVALAFTVSASGWPTLDLLETETAATPGSFSFNPATGGFTYTPAYADIGAVSFTFTASNNLGMATQVVDVVVAEGLSEAPSPIWASATNTTDFTAAWGASGGATGYLLDVGAQSNFMAGSLSTDLVAFDFAGYAGDETEGISTFAAVGMQAPAFIVRGTGLTAAANAGRFNAGGWSTNHADAAAALAAGDYFEWTVQPGASHVAMSITNISLIIQRSSGGASNLALRASHDGYAVDLAGTNGIATNTASLSLSGDLSGVPGLQNVSGPVTFRLAGWGGQSSGSLGFEGTGDDILIQGSISTPAYIPGYSNLSVAGTSQSVTGLAAGATYYFRARAVSGTGTGSYSSVASVATKANQAIHFAPIDTQVATNVVHLSATASSGLPVTFAVAGGPASISSGTNLTFSASGTVSIVASQAGDAQWAPADNVTNTVNVNKAKATVALGNLSQTWDGNAKTVTVTTVPAGLSVDVTYDGSAVAPSNAGSYAVTGTVNEVLYQGTTNGTLLISGVPALNAAGPFTATTGVALAFTMSATGYPVPVLALESTTASSGYVFVPGTGELAYTPPLADAGATQTFTFTASNDLGVATQQVSVAVVEGAVEPPASVWAGATNTVDFTADWSPVAAAIGYRLDVSPRVDFASNIAGTNLVAFDFADYAGNESQGMADAVAPHMQAPVFITRGTGLTATVNAGRFNAQGWENHADASAALAAGDYFEWTIQPATNYAVMSITNIALNIQRSSSGASNLALRASHDSYAADLLGTNGMTNANSTIAISGDMSGVSGLQNVTGPITFRMAGWAGATNGSMGFEGAGSDILIQGTVSTPACIPGYSNLSVAGTSQSVTGLTAGATYYFRVRSVSTEETGTYSSVASVATKANQAIRFAPIGDQAVTDMLVLEATALSGLPVSFAVASGPASLSGGSNLTFSATGVVSVVASQAGDSAWNAAPSVTNFFNVTKAYASVTLQNLSQTYDGTAKAVSATTFPAGLTVEFTYDGSAVAPSNAGSYAVTGTVNDVTYQGYTTATLTISKATAVVTLGSLDQTYDGTPKNATATTVPAGLTVNFTYDGSASAPTEVGSYAVTGTVSDANYDGSAAGTLVISAAADPFEQWLQNLNLDPQDSNYATNSDYDADGMNTWEEYLADTDPALSGSVLEITGTFNVVDRKYRMVFPQSTGRYYQLEYSTNLFQGTILSNLGWGVPGRVITNEPHTNGSWFWGVRSRLSAP